MRVTGTPRAHVDEHSAEGAVVVDVRFVSGVVSSGSRTAPSVRAISKHVHTERKCQLRPVSISTGPAIDGRSRYSLTDAPRSDHDRNVADVVAAIVDEARRRSVRAATDEARKHRV